MSEKNREEKEFWDWFDANQEKYLNFEADQDRLFHELKKQLEKLDRHLTFEFSSLLDDGKRELVLSADGIRGSFGSVMRLAERAPSFEKWIIVPFRQPRTGLMEIAFNEVKLDFHDVYFRYKQDGNKLGIELNIKDYKDTKDWGIASFIMLDTLLGEYDTEMFISWIEKKKLDEAMIGSMMPISKLAELVNRLKKTSSS